MTLQMFGVLVLAVFTKLSMATENSGDNIKVEDTQNKALKQSRQHDQNRPTDQYQVILGGRPLTIGGELSFETEFRDDFSLDDNQKEDVWDLELEFELEFLYQWNDALTGFAEIVVKYEDELYLQDGDGDDDISLERGQAWLFYNKTPSSPYSFQLGRQSFKDEREWWWDQSLDAIRFHYDVADLHAEISFAQELFRVSTANDLDAEEEDVLRILAELSWNWAPKQTVSLFAAYQNDSSTTPIENQFVTKDDEDENDAELTWHGISARGKYESELVDKFYYWTNLARVSGSDKVIDFDNADNGQSIVDEVDNVDVSGWALDFGVTLPLEWAGQPNLTFAYAFGSGDGNLNDNKDKIFRSTGLEDYEAKFRGVNRFHYYGEVVQPDLSNIHISTIALGYPVFESSSVEFLFHDYRQAHASDNDRIGRISTRPNGIDKEIGQAIEIVFGYEESEHFELEVIAGAFIAGSAYGDDEGNTAFNVMLQLDYNF